MGEAFVRTARHSPTVCNHIVPTVCCSGYPVNSFASGLPPRAGAPELNVRTYFFSPNNAMKKLTLLVVVIVGAWQWYSQSQRQQAAAAVENELASTGTVQTEKPNILGGQSYSKTYSCDGRTHCSQMTSCEEATYFLQNCPGTKMDGNNDGVPCEQQWCGR